MSEPLRSKSTAQPNQISPRLIRPASVAISCPMLCRLLCRLAAMGVLVSTVGVKAQDATDFTAAARSRNHVWVLADPQVQELMRLDEERFPDSLAAVISDVLTDLQREGYLDARIDSAVSNGDSLTTLFAVRGLRFRIRTLDIYGALVRSEASIRLAMNTREGQILNMEVLEADLQAILTAYDRIGHLTAEAVINDIFLERGIDEGLIDVTISIDEGERPSLSEVRIAGGMRTRLSFLTRLAGMRVGEKVEHFEPDELQRQLVSTGLFKSVERPAMFITETGAALLVVALEEGPPGNFDAVLGYLPATGASEKGSIVGNVDIALRHVFGAGRRFAFRFNRLPARVTRISISGEDPRIAGWPIRFSAAFDGYQRDSTFTRQQLQLEAGYEIVRDVELFATISRENTRPGIDSLINVPRSNTWFAGLGFSVHKLDNAQNPRAGWQLRANFEQGRKSRSLVSGRANNTGARNDKALGQKRLKTRGQVFFPVGDRQTLLLAGESSLLESGVYDESDLFRLGGANSLRGYNEEQFLGNVVGRGTVEWRYLLDPTSFVFAFFDMGFLGKPDTSTTLQTIEGGEVASERWTGHPGYGFGLRFGTTAGLFSVSLALNPDEGLGAKVHVGISLGL